jgi:hypothetical protein
MGRAMVDRETLRIDGAVPNLGEFAACRDVTYKLSNMRHGGARKEK